MLRSISNQWKMLLNIKRRKKKQQNRHNNSIMINMKEWMVVWTY